MAGALTSAFMSAQAAKAPIDNIQYKVDANPEYIRWGWAMIVMWGIVVLTIIYWVWAKTFSLSFSIFLIIMLSIIYIRRKVIWARETAKGYKSAYDIVTK